MKYVTRYQKWLSGPASSAVNEGLTSPAAAAGAADSDDDDGDKYLEGMSDWAMLGVLTQKVVCAIAKIAMCQETQSSLNGSWKNC